MKTILSGGHTITNTDQKVLEEYLLVTPREWAEKALKGMINKSIKMILKDYFEIYASKQSTTVSMDYSVLIPEIIELEEFQLYNTKTPLAPIFSRKEEISVQILQNGIEIEGYEDMALRAYYEDPETMLAYYIENKIYQRRKAFIKSHTQKIIASQSISEVPANPCDFINLIVSLPGYKNRTQQEAELD